MLALNLADVRTLERRGRRVRTGIWKLPTPDRILARAEGLVGDTQGDRSVHGGRHKAVYAYASEDSRWWGERLGRALEPGSFGENLTTAGVDVSGAVVGERWRVGGALLEVSEPRLPCWKLGARLGDPRLPKRFAAAGRPGAYLRVLAEGEVGAGDAVELVERPGHGVTVALLSEARLRDRSLAPRLLAATSLSPAWREWAESAAA